MAKNLLIVESPAKAKTISKFLGDDFIVKASFGHIRDLPKDNSAVDINNNFNPIYEVSADKSAIVSELIKLAKTSDKVWLASDEDREGEAISWHLAEALKLNPEKTHRIVFHEITQKAIQNAIQNPRSINMDLVNAQQARRVLDRLVGFELSPVLWKKLKPGLSAGRVQSVTVRLIVDREREINEFTTTSYFKITADLIGSNHKNSFKAELTPKLKDQDAASFYLNHANGAKFSVENLEVKPTKRTPSAPFTTSTLQQEASRKLGLGVTQTMRIAQNLYEAGHITYMRTDSVNLSDFALQAIENEIVKSFGSKYHKQRKYKTKTANAQEAHEAIRPTNVEVQHVSNDPKEQKLYELIWNRTVASQMEDAILEKTIVTIGVDPKDKKTKLQSLTATGEVIKFDGFLKLYIESNDDSDEDENEDSVLLPPMTVGQDLNLVVMKATEKFTRPSARYNEAGLVKKLEELGIGRPSTYAPTINTVQKREYVVKESRDGVKREFVVMTLKNESITESKASENTGAEKNKLFPTDLGIIVTDFLVEYFPDIVDYQFTAKVEQEFDEISLGQIEWAKMIGNFYSPFHLKVSDVIETAERVSKEKVLGVDPESGKQVIVRMGKFGPLVQMGTSDDEDKKFASLQTGMRIDTITLEQALGLFALPRVVGEYEDKPIKVAIGRFGPYLAHNSLFYSLPKGVSPYLVTLEESLEIIEAKREKERNRIIKIIEGNGVTFQILNGRWGPYIEVNYENLKIPKDKVANAAELTLEECEELYKDFMIKNPNGTTKAKAKITKDKAKEKAKEKANKPKKVVKAKVEGETKAADVKAKPKTTTKKATTTTKKTTTKKKE